MRAPATGYRQPTHHGASHKGDGLGKYPRICTGCGQPVRITGPTALWFETGPDRTPRSWHAQCRLNIRPPT